jgi:hypothetical protein
LSQSPESPSTSQVLSEVAEPLAPRPSLQPPSSPPVLQNPIRVAALVDSNEGGVNSGAAAGIVTPAAAEVLPVAHGEGGTVPVGIPVDDVGVQGGFAPPAFGQPAQPAGAMAVDSSCTCM